MYSVITCVKLTWYTHILRKLSYTVFRASYGFGLLYGKCLKMLELNDVHIGQMLQAVCMHIAMFHGTYVSKQHALDYSKWVPSFYSPDNALFSVEPNVRDSVSGCCRVLLVRDELPMSVWEIENEIKYFWQGEVWLFNLQAATNSKDPTSLLMLRQVNLFSIWWTPCLSILYRFGVQSVFAVSLGIHL